MITSVLLISSILFFTFAVRFRSYDSKLHNQSALILGIAGVVYLIMTIVNIHFPDVNLRPFRYLDWFITVPLMVRQMIGLATIKGTYDLTYSIITSVLMLVCGVAGELGILDKVFMGIVGLAFAIQTFLPLFNQIDRRTNRIYYILMIGWLFYPIVYFASDSINLISMYSVVDLTVKIGFANYLYAKLI